MSRKYIGKKHTYRINDQRYFVFKQWCHEKGIDVSSAIQGAVGLLMKKGNISVLLQNQENRNLAVNLLNEIREEEK